jgi:preprotein translocase subunit SecA
MFNILEKIFGSKNDRYLSGLQPHVERINELEPDMEAKSDEELKAQTPKFKEKLDRGADLDDIMHEAFATVREVSKRTLGMRHFDVQLMGAICLHQGNIGEMKTGEGKTLVATMPLYLNALEEKGCHLITVNDYLAERDAEWMGHIYRFLGLEVGTILSDMGTHKREQAYRADITYGTNNEFGFDYLRDNMKTNLDEMVQRDLHYGIIDEVDSVLIDESRTPLIISGKADQSTELYHEVNNIIPYLKRDHDYLVDEEDRSVTLSDGGVEKVEERLGIDNLYDPDNIEMLHHVNKALEAHTLYKKDDQYIVRDGEVVIVDEFTGRPMPGRRWSDGLHQAVEAKEGVPIKDENQTLATVTFQNFFRMYDKLAGMTGTAKTEEKEFQEFYDLDTYAIPTNEPVIRKDYDDVVYRSYDEKFDAIVEQIVECNDRGQPVLVGTTSVEKSEALSRVLHQKDIDHDVLNAKYHEQEAKIVAQAGRLGSVTIATNMAGRGTDILLGGNPEFLAEEVAGEQDIPPGTPKNQRHEYYTDEYQEALDKFEEECAEEGEQVKEAGGLFIIGTERHESRRIDNQLRGRSGRQGDPGASRFFLSLEDDLLRRFGAENIGKLMDTLDMEKGVPIEHNMVTRSIENAQSKVEARNFDIRKNLLEYDDVMDKQRKTIYALRKHVLKGEDEDGRNLREMALDLFEDVALSIIDDYASESLRYEDWDLETLESKLEQTFNIEFDIRHLKGRSAIETRVWDHISDVFFDKEGEFEELAEKINEHRREQIEEAAEQAEQAETDEDVDDAEAAIKTKDDDEAAASTDDNDWQLPEELEDEFEDEDDIEVTGQELFEEQVRNQYLWAIDRYWREHLQAMEQLRDGIGMRGYAQKDPKQEYKKEGYHQFLDTLMNIKTQVVEFIAKMDVETPDALQERPESQLPDKIKLSHGEETSTRDAESGQDTDAEPDSGGGGSDEPFEQDLPQIGRNDPCHCGSGRKYKKCCLREDRKKKKKSKKNDDDRRRAG